jgi:hypothetical protein
MWWDPRMNWKRLIQSLKPEAVFQAPATTKQLKAVEKELKVKLPPDLCSLLEVSNGVAEFERGWPVVYSSERIIETNRNLRTSFRDIFMPLDPLLFVSDASNGDYFGYSICGGKIRRSHIFVWDHEDDSRKWVAQDLSTFVKTWLNGTLSI